MWFKKQKNTDDFRQGFNIIIIISFIILILGVILTILGLYDRGNNRPPIPAIALILHFFLFIFTLNDGKKICDLYDRLSSKIPDIEQQAYEKGKTELSLENQNLKGEIRRLEAQIYGLRDRYETGQWESQIREAAYQRGLSEARRQWGTREEAIKSQFKESYQPKLTKLKFLEDELEMCKTQRDKHRLELKTKDREIEQYIAKLSEYQKREHQWVAMQREYHQWEVRMAEDRGLWDSLRRQNEELQRENNRLKDERRVEIREAEMRIEELKRRDYEIRWLRSQLGNAES